MTDFHSMTDQELNEWIFKAKGWQKLLFPAVPEWQRPSNTPGVNVKLVECWYEPVPDYCNDWKWAGELLEEMKEYGVILEYTHDHNFTPPEYRWFVHFPNRATKARSIIVSCEFPTRAISEAYAVMTESLGDMTKKDGEQ